MGSNKNRPAKQEALANQSVDSRIQEITKQLAQLSDLLIKERQALSDAKPKPVKEFAPLIAETRKEQKVSQQVLANLAGVSIGTVQAIENGKNTVTLQNLERVLGVLGKSLWIK